MCKMGPKVKNAKSVDEVYLGLPSKYGCVRSCKHTEFDVAVVLVGLDETVLSDGVLSFETGPDKFEVFVATEGGIWEQQKGTGMLTHVVHNVRRRMETLLLGELKTLLCWLRSTDQDTAKVKQAELEYAQAQWLHDKLGSKAFVASVVHVIMQQKMISTRDLGVSRGDFDTRSNCMGFTDGVYDFEARRLVKGAAAMAYFVTKTVGYEYGDVMEVDDESLGAFDMFFEQIHGKAENREYLLVRLRNAARKVNDQVLLVHYNVAGSNGKSTWFSLVKQAFGDLFMDCSTALLVAPAFNNPGAANEELMSIKGMSVILFSEPSSKHKLHAAFLKKLTGGDSQSTRANYGKKETFTFMGLANILCNRIPELDDMDGGVQRRIKCLPYESMFVAAGSPLVGSPNVHVIDKEVEKRFAVWKMCLMRRVLEAAVAAQDPEDVVEHTRRLVEREDVIAQFVHDVFVTTDCKTDILKREDVWAEYIMYCKGKHATMKYHEFNDEIVRMLGEPTKKSGNLRNFWRGMVVYEQPCEPDAYD